MERKNNKIVPESIAVGDIMCFINYVEVKSCDKNEIIAKDLYNGKVIKITGKELLEEGFSADFFQEEVNVTKTQAAELLVNSFNKPFTVSFVKQDGQERTLRGKLVRHEVLLGRSVVEDLDEEKTNNIRQVDHRTINYLIVEGTKYIVKQN